MNEGYPWTARLIRVLQRWQDANGLPRQCALEQQFEDISASQEAWLERFCWVWDKVQGADR